MKLQEVFDQLRYGELSQLNIGGAREGTINVDSYPALISHINLGLTAIYKRFYLREGRYTIPLVSGTTVYPVKDVYLDPITGESVDGEIFKIEKVTTELDTELNLNMSSDMYACSTPTLTSLRVPSSIVENSIDLPQWYRTSYLDVICRVNHPKLTLGDAVFDPYAITLELPYAYLTPLLYFVASRIHNPIGMVNEFNAGNNYAAKFENECQQLEAQNIQIDKDTGNTKLYDKGWV